MERKFYRDGLRHFSYECDKEPKIAPKRNLSQVGNPREVTSKFGRVRAKVKLLKTPELLKELIGIRGDATSGLYNQDPFMGCDPELFLQDPDGATVPAFKVLASKKTNPSIFWDGFQAEFTTLPNQCLMQLRGNISCQLLQLKNALKVVSPGTDIGAGDVVTLPSQVLRETSDEHAALGCDPSYNLYGMSGELPGDARALPYRFAGGHIHFGDAALAADQNYAAKVVLNLDKVLGVWSVGVAERYETTKVRRKHYGLAGEFRLPKHGLEYRTLSNFWLMDPCLFYVTFELARVVMRATSYGLLDFWVSDQQTVIDVINNYDVSGARKLLRLNEKLFKTLFTASNSRWSSPFCDRRGNIVTEPELAAKEALALSLEGMDEVAPEMIFKNWESTETWMSYVSRKYNNAPSATAVAS